MSDTNYQKINVDHVFGESTFYTQSLPMLVTGFDDDSALPTNTYNGVLGYAEEYQQAVGVEVKEDVTLFEFKFRTSKFLSFSDMLDNLTN